MQWKDPIECLEDQTRRLALQEKSTEMNHIPSEQLNFRITSQIELVQFLYRHHPEFGLDIMKAFTMKHPLALAKQQELCSLRPKVFAIVMKIALTRDHPYKQLPEYRTLISLLEDCVPRTGTSDEALALWEQAVDGAMFCFTTCVCIQDALVAEDMSCQLLTSDIVPILENRPSLHIIRPDMMPGILCMNDVCVHGSIQPRQFQYLMEIGNAFKYFLSRKIIILKNLESDPNFIVGLCNIAVRVKGFPPVFVNFILKQNPGIDHHKKGVNFSDLVPMVCVNHDCYANGSCSEISHNLTNIYIRVNSVKEEDPTMAAQNTINFTTMTQVLDSLSQGLNQSHAEPLVDVPIVKHSLTPYLESNNEIKFHTSWDTRYLHSVAIRYHMISFADEIMMQVHMHPKSEPAGYQDDGMRFDKDFFGPFQLFFPEYQVKL